MKHYIKIILLIIVLFLILFLTLQSPEQTWALTHTVQNFLLCLFPDGTVPNWITDGKLFRHAAHIPEYFLLGLALCAVFTPHKHGLWFTVAFGLLIGLCDETLKHFLPTRDFSARDLAFDAIGIVLAAALWEAVRYAKMKITKTATGAEANGW